MNQSTGASQLLGFATTLGSEPRLWIKQEPESEPMKTIFSTDISESRHWITTMIQERAITMKYKPSSKSEPYPPIKSIYESEPRYMINNKI